MQEYFEIKQEQERRDHIGKVGCQTPEFGRPSPPPSPVMQAKGATEYITISAAEYHFLTKVAAFMEIILSTDGFVRDAVVDAAKKALSDVPGSSEAGEKE